LWVFPALTCLFVAIFFQSDFHILTLLLLFFWFIRLLTLNISSVTLVSIVLSILLICVIWVNEGNDESILDPSQTDFSILVKPTTFEIDGDLLQLEGIVYTQKSNEKVKLRYYIQSEEEKIQLETNGPPKFVRASGELEKPNKKRNFDQFDYSAYLKRQNIYYIIEADGFTPKYKKQFKKDVPFTYKIDRLRNQLFQEMDSRLFKETADYAKTVLFAKDSSISEEVMDSYRSLGLIHLLSISGLHIQLLISVVSYILMRIGISRETTSKILLVILPVYGLLAGFGIGVFRSVVQAMARSIFLLFHRSSPSIDNWSIALFLILLINPMSIYSVGFQLSYSLSGILILLSNAKWRRSLPPWKNGLIMSLCIHLISIPILSYHFYEFPLASLLMNTLFVPFFTWILFPTIIIVFLLSWFLYGTLAFNLIVEILNQMIQAVELVLQALGNFKGMSFISGRLSPYAMIALILGIIFLLCSFDMKKKRGYLWIGFVLVFCSLFSKQYSPLGFVMMVDVGQGESIVIKEPFSKEAILIDTGGQLSWSEKENWQKREESFSIGENLLVPVLKSQGITQLEQVFLTHGDVDHIGELSSLVNNFKVKEIITGETAYQSDELKSQVEKFEKRDPVLTLAQAPHIFHATQTPMVLLHPDEPTNDSNEDSFVLYAEIGKYNWLFTGDIEEQAERKLIKKYPNVKIDILNVAHHGSNTSTSEKFLNSYNPGIAMISAGENNTYGHPNSLVIERLENKNIQIYRTDLDGAIMYKYSNIGIINNIIQEFTINNDRKKD